MRVKCEFTTQSLPLNYNMMFVNLIMEAVKNSDENYFNKLYSFKDQMNKDSGNFCFSVFMEDYVTNGESVSVKSGLNLIVSSPDAEFFIHLYNGLLKIECFSYGDFIVKRGSIDILNEKEVSSDEMLFKTLSPICVQDSSGYFMKLEDKGFEDEINYIAGKVLENYRGEGLRQKLAFEPVKVKKIVVKEDSRGTEEKTGSEIINVDCYSGVFKLSGHQGDLKDLYILGLGFRRSQGFGMLEVVC